MENVIAEDRTDSKRKREISTQTDFDVYSKFPPQSGNNGTKEQLRLFNDIHGNKSGFNLRKTVSKLFKPKPSRTRSSSIIESHHIAPLATPESESPASHCKTDLEMEMSVRQPLLPQMDSKLDFKTETSQLEGGDNREEDHGESFKAATGNRVKITADLHHA